MNTFTNTTVQSVLDKVSVWEMDKAVSSTHRINKRGEHLFFARTTQTTRYVVWSVVDGKVQRREYQRNRRTGVTTLFVDYYQPSPTQDKYLNAAYKTEEYLSDSYFDRAAERAAWNV